MVYVPTLYIVSYNGVIKYTCNINHRRNAYKTDVLLLLLSILVTQKIFATKH